MKTIEQLWKENGEKSGLKISVPEFSKKPMVVCAQVPKDKSFIGYYFETSEPFKISGNCYECYLYQEPKPRRLAWVCKTSSENPFGYRQGDITFCDSTAVLSDAVWDRAPWLDEPEEKK